MNQSQSDSNDKDAKESIFLQKIVSESLPVNKQIIVTKIDSELVPAIDDELEED